MRNKIIIVLPLVFFTMMLNGQVSNAKTDTVFVKGYIFKEISKADIVRCKKNFNEKRKNHKTSIDFPARYLFLEGELNQKDIVKNLDSIYNNGLSSFFSFCPIQKSRTIFDEILGHKKDNFNCKTPLLNSNFLYRLKGRKYKLYEIYYIEGYWLKMKYNPKLDYITSSFKTELINRDKENIDLFYLIDCVTFETSIKFLDKRIKEFKR